MTPDMNNDPLVLIALAATAWALLGLQSWRARRASRQVKNDHTTSMRDQRPDAPKTSSWRNRWH